MRIASWFLAGAFTGYIISNWVHDGEINMWAMLSPMMLIIVLTISQFMDMRENNDRGHHDY